MSNIDDKILEALSAEDKEVMASYGKELGLFGLMAESFRGKLGVATIAVFIMMLAFALVLVYSAINFFSVEEIAPKLNWLAIALTALIVVALARLWYWMELIHLSIIREVKRPELHVSLLANKLKQRDSTPQ
jgi:hypothetical protein